MLEHGIGRCRCRSFERGNIMTVLARIFSVVAFVSLLAVPACAGKDGAEQNPYAVDQAAYVERVKARIVWFLETYNFRPSSGCLQLYGEEACNRYLDFIKKMDFTIIPPIEWSETDPNLPSTQEMRVKCPKLPFENSEIMYRAHWKEGIPVKGRANFGLYRISDYIDVPEPVYAYRAEDLFTVLGYGDPNTQKKLSDGHFSVFGYPSCKRYKGQSITKDVDKYGGGRYIHEFAIYNGNLIFFRISSLGTEGGTRKEEFIMSFYKYEKELKGISEFRSFVTYK